MREHRGGLLHVVHDVVDRRQVTYYTNDMARTVNLPKLIQLRMSAELEKRVDAWRREQEDLPSRSEAIRRLVEQGLGSVDAQRKR